MEAGFQALTVVLGGQCQHSKCFATQYNSLLQQQGINVVIVDDFLNHTICDLLEVLGISELPSIISQGVVHSGVHAFDKMTHITGNECATKGGSDIKMLASKQVLDKMHILV